MIVEYITYPSKETLQIIKYVVVGGITYLVDYLTFNLFLLSGLHYLIADTLNIPIVLSFNYVMHSLFTYKRRINSKSTIGKYLINSIVLYIYSIILLSFMIEVLNLDESLAKIIQLGSIPPVNYFLLRNLVFTQHLSTVETKI